MGLKIKILRFLNSLGLVVKEYSPKNSERAMLNYLFKKFDINHVIDVGANKGQFGNDLRANGYIKKIDSFEPLLDAYEELEKCASQDDNWNVYNVAIGNESGSTEVFVAENSHSSSLLEIDNQHVVAAPDSKTIGKQTITIKPLVELITIEENSSVLLKIDTQGFELEVLKGAKESLKDIELILVELSFVELYKNAPLAHHIVDYLDNQGFELYSMFPEFTDPTNYRLLQSNGFFVKKK